MKMVSGAGSLSQGNFTASATCPEMKLSDLLLSDRVIPVQNGRNCYRPTTDVVSLLLW